MRQSPKILLLLVTLARVEVAYHPIPSPPIPCLPRPDQTRPEEKKRREERRGEDMISFKIWGRAFCPPPPSQHNGSRNNGQGEAVLLLGGRRQVHRKRPLPEKILGGFCPRRFGRLARARNFLARARIQFGHSCSSKNRSQAPA